MLEFILVLPFVFLVFALIMNFGHVYLARQRLFAAAKESAFLHTAFLQNHVAESSGQEANRGRTETEGSVNKWLLAPRGLKARLSISRGNDGGFRDKLKSEGVSFGLGAVVAAIGDIVGKLSSTQEYRIDTHYQPLVGTLLPEIDVSQAIKVDAWSWTCSELPGGYTGTVLSKLQDMTRSLHVDPFKRIREKVTCK